MLWSLVCVILAIGFYPTWTELAKLWFDTESYAHGPIVPMISLWLVWRLRAELSRNLRPAIWWIGIVGLVASGILWLTGEVLQVSSFRHFAVVLMLIAAIATCFGRDVFCALLFPILFLLFAVPFGDFLIEPMMDQTADMAVIALQWTGIPVFREARSIQIPTGRWAVVEACAGTRYLIASVMLGTLFSYLFFRSWSRRIAFVVAAIVVPVVANWLRAYLIIMAGHLSQNTIGVGADHVLFGWVFFGVFIFAMFSIGARWREDSLDRPHFNIVSSAKRVSGLSLHIAALLATLGVAALPVVAAMMVPTGRAISLTPFIEKSDWPTDVRELWAPDLSGERGRLNLSFRPKNGVSVSAFRAVYEAQRGQNRMLRFGNRLYPDSENISAKIETRSSQITLSDRVVPIVEYKMPERVGVRIIRTYYQIGQTDTASPYTAKIHLAARLLSGQGDRSTVIVWSAYAADAEQARAVLNAFESAFGEQLAKREP